MKTIRLIAIFLSISLILAVTAIPAFAAGPDVSLLGVDFITGKGLVVYFNVGPDFDPDQAGSVVVNGVSYPLSCHFNDGGLLVCIAAVKKTAIGELADISLGDSSFEVIVPAANIPIVSFSSCSSYTYNVIDYGPEDGNTDWHVFDTYTQCSPAELGDTLHDYYNPEYDDTFDYIFSELAGECGEGDPDLGDGYYYNCD
jgi:hypothetical protein